MSAESIQSTSASEVTSAISSVLVQWNSLSASHAQEAILPCCGSRAWAEAMVAARPFADEPTLLAYSDRAWQSLAREAWQQAFDSHPRLGETRAKAATETSLAWSKQEQAKASPSDALREANTRYEQKFGRIFLFCANGRTAVEILAALAHRMQNDPETEWREAGEQQRRITRLRLQRWLHEP